jgi:hypothetical protein
LRIAKNFQELMVTWLKQDLHIDYHLSVSEDYSKIGAGPETHSWNICGNPGLSFASIMIKWALIIWHRCVQSCRFRCC